MRGFIIGGLLIIGSLLSACATFQPTSCYLTCQLGINQNETLTVQQLVDKLVAVGWMQDDPDRVYSYRYGQGYFSLVQETSIELSLDGNPPPPYRDSLVLYTNWIGGINPDDDLIPDTEISVIYAPVDMTIRDTWHVYGIPDAGDIIPFINWRELRFIGYPCWRSYYSAIYYGGRLSVQAYVDWPIFKNYWSTPVVVSYAVGSSQRFTNQLGPYYTVDNIFCVPG